jgi:parallel beta-helix repeat protein
MNIIVRTRNPHCLVWIVLTLPCLLALTPSGVWATTYFVDANHPNASDTNPGTEALPFKTISRATPRLQAGDTLLIRAGIYRETVTLSRSGTATDPITIRAYPGHEGKAIINAAEPVTNWHKCTGPYECAGNPYWDHIYYADVAGLVAAHPDKTFAVRQVFQQGQLLNRSRYPDTGWSYPTTIVDPETTFTDNTLSKPSGYFAGAVCHIKTEVWQIDPAPIASFSSSTIVLTAKPNPYYDISTRFGYYITSIVGEINAEGEWAYDPARKRLYLWPRGEVAENVEFTYRETCLGTTDGVSFNVVRGLTMRNAYRYGILICRSHHVTIENNTIEHSFDRGIRLQSTGGSCDDNNILRNTIRYSCSSGINVDDTAARYNIEGNYIYATGTDHFAGDLMNGMSSAMFIWGPFGRVCNNRIDRTGYCALYIAGNPINREIFFNYTSNTGLAISDGGSGIYTGGFYTGPEKDHIHHNIFADTIGCLTMDIAYDKGPPVTMERYSGGSPGIYVDEEGNNRIIEHNTVINSHYAGIFFHGAPGNIVQKNTLYGNQEMQVLLVGRTSFGGQPRERMRLVDDVVQNNILFATDAQQQTLHLITYYEDFHFGWSDSNYFYNPYANAHIYVDHYVASQGGNVRTTLSLDQWQAMSGYDSNSREFSYLDQLPQVTLASPVESRIVYNASLDVNTIDLGPDLYCDVQGNGIHGKLTLQPFESKILISAVAAVVSHQATNPVPSDGGQVGVVPLLEWTPGVTAAFHDVYLGEEEDAVEAADTASPLYQGRQTDPSFPLAGLVQPGGRYFWRVDEMETDGTTIHKGVVWTFTTADYLVIDDFESYTDQKGSRIEETWNDGSINNTGSQVGRWSNPSTPWTSGDHGEWSMLLAYDNAGPPFVSEVGREFSPQQDWTAGEMNTLSLWIQGDIVSFDETAPGTFTMSAAGADIWGIAGDEFRYAYQQLDGDGSIVTKIERVEETHYWAKAGVMIRESLNPTSSYAFMFVTPTGLRAFQNRPANNDWTKSAHGGTEFRGSWVKLERKGNQFTGYHSRDGINWTRQSETENTGWDASPNPQTIHMPPRVYVGLALTSHADIATTATFSGVEITGSVTDSWQVAEIGADHPGNSPDDLYVAIEDSGGAAAVVVHPDPAAVNTTVWTEWRIPLGMLDGVDLSQVRKMCIGVGGRTGPALDGAGRIYIDDIHIYKEAPEPGAKRVH